MPEVMVPTTELAEAEGCAEGCPEGCAEGCAESLRTLRASSMSESLWTCGKLSNLFRI
jgi:hypothetical protein